MKERNREKKELRIVLALGGVATAALLIFSRPFLYRIVIEPFLLRRSNPGSLPRGALAVGAPLPALPITDTRGRAQELSRVAAGKLTLVFFVASWCESCGQTLRDLNTLRQAYEKAGLQTIALHVASTEHRDRALGLIRREGFPDQSLFFIDDPAGEKRYLGNDRIFPLIVIADARGAVTGILRGPADRSALEQGIRAVISE